MPILIASPQAAKAFQDHQEKHGKPKSHALAKELVYVSLLSILLLSDVTFHPTVPELLVRSLIAR
jgi:hypothetical protein